VGEEEKVTSIEADIRSWSSEVLEVPNEHLDGLPACPYAKAAWAKNKVSVVEVDNIYSGMAHEADKFFDHDYDLVIVASYTLPDADDFWGVTEILNDLYAKRDLHLMVFHPEYGAEEADLDFLYDHEWESGIDAEYCMVFIQRLSQVDEASRSLQKLGYYKAFSREDFETLVLDRRRRLKNGDETSLDEEEG
jgi:hypothetical protein